MDSKVTNTVFELPAAAVAKLTPKPCEEDDFPLLNYPQNGKGTCGVSAWSSSFYYWCDTYLTSLIYFAKKWTR